MVYKIVKYIERDHKFNKEKGIYELIEKEKFYAKRKGTIFGFWHDVGDFIWDSGGGFTTLNTFDTIKEAESYVRCFHAERYHDKNCVIL
jgi:hypothetical protein